MSDKLEVNQNHLHFDAGELQRFTDGKVTVYVPKDAVNFDERVVRLSRHPVGYTPLGVGDVFSYDENGILHINGVPV